MTTNHDTDPYDLLLTLKGSTEGIRKSTDQSDELTIKFSTSKLRDQAYDALYKYITASIEEQMKNLETEAELSGKDDEAMTDLHYIYPVLRKRLAKLSTPEVDTPTIAGKITGFTLFSSVIPIILTVLTLALFAVYVVVCIWALL